jgi:hypothetical protein
MIQQSMTDQQFWGLVKDLYPVIDGESELVQERQKDRQENLMNLFKSSPTIKDIKGTNWAAYQAFTEYYDHFSNIPGKDGQAEKDARALKVFEGEFDKMKQTVFRKLQVA